MSARFIFNPSQLATVLTALQVAADQYSQDAHTADTSNAPRLAEQFRAQRKEALALAEIIEECHE